MTWDLLLKLIVFAAVFRVGWAIPPFIFHTIKRYFS